MKGITVNKPTLRVPMMGLLSHTSFEALASLERELRLPIVKGKRVVPIKGGKKASTTPNGFSG